MDSLSGPNVEVLHWLPESPHHNRVKGCSQEGHFDSERVAYPPSCSALGDIQFPASNAKTRSFTRSSS
jgi:hypothetical protein